MTALYEYWAAWAALASGTSLGLVVLFVSKRGPSLDVILDDRIDDLEEETENLMEHLGDLKAFAARTDKDVLMEDEVRAKSEVAEVLERRNEALQEKAKSVVERSTQKSATKGFLWGMATTAVLGFLVWSANDAKLSRPEGGPMTGGGPAMQGTASGQAGAEKGGSPEIQALLAKLKDNPDDLQSTNELVRLLLRSQMFEQAETLNIRALKLDPENADAMVHNAVLRGAKEGGPAGIAALDSVLESHPKHPDAWFFKGMLSMQGGDNALVKECFSKFVEFAPESPRRDRIAAMLKSPMFQ